MRYLEVLEAADRLRTQHDEIEKRRRARERIAAADQKRALAARRYRDDVDRANDAARKAKAELSRSDTRENACSAGGDCTLNERTVRYLRDRNGVLLGSLYAVGRILQAKDCHGSIAGWYDPRSDQTRDRSGSIVGSGDLLSALLFRSASLRKK